VARGDVDKPERTRPDSWEWLVAHVHWTGAAFGIVLSLFWTDPDRSDPLAWGFVALVAALVWLPAAERLRRIFLVRYPRE
jgi:hypothetical protein